MFWPFLTLQFSTQTCGGDEYKKKITSSNHFNMHVSCLICCVGGSVAAVRLFLICQFGSVGAAVVHNPFTPVPCHRRAHMYANTLGISSSQCHAIWWVVTECRHRRQPTVSLMFGRHSHRVLAGPLLTNCWQAGTAPLTSDGASTDSCHCSCDCRQKLNHS